MTTQEIRVASKLSITAGMATAAMAIGLLIVFWGYASQTLPTIGMGSFVMGVGGFVALICATAYLFGKR